ncbi:transposase [Paraburkholderia pallida]|uniref:IS66 family insertion sequence element accessory protein TnpB n=1 Tax=Paraburkholderia pallida TaxID=2547399 RepID=A0A4P7DAI2_9BURK|nr:transposase [Paraburkholderia pallida]QBR04023.1 IS66 family insertion sequence element accessory protein TnpB [Paraburkholderia pallida]QBR04220.1 IS66 family insertion sequence element accessory protein TnpB [Paraburkholderia pallida]QBR04279.1 IS66 family insertion sequence element accessory protein TnpB [Paraburkholderia pallida]
MNENRDLRSRLVVGQKRDGRREFNEDAVRELVALCLKPGVSIARAAMDHDVNPNQLRRWIARYQPQILHDPREPDSMVIDGVSIDISAPTVRSAGNANAFPAFVPVIPAPVSPSTPSTPVRSMALALHVRLPNGVELDFGEAGVEEITTIIHVLGRLACSGSTKV